MILGSCLEADNRIRDYEAKVRMQKRMVRDRAIWEEYERQENEDMLSRAESNSDAAKRK
jgi:hypothetical protein